MFFLVEMKIIVVSDTHFRTQKIIERLEIIEDIDMIMHLGDIMSDGRKIGDALGVKTLTVKGNCDFGLEDERFRLEWVSASEGPRFAQVVKELTEQIKKLGPSPYKM